MSPGQSCMTGFAVKRRRRFLSTDTRREQQFQKYMCLDRVAGFCERFISNHRVVNRKRISLSQQWIQLFRSKPLGLEYSLPLRLLDKHPEN